MAYRKLTKEEISRLIQQNCTAEDWENIQVEDRFNTTYVSNVTFSGNIRLGLLDEMYSFPGGLQKHSCIRNVCLHNCTVGDNVYLENIHNYIANYEIGNNVCIQNTESIYVEGETSFGNGVQIAVMNETGGREVTMSDVLSAHFAYIQSFYRHRPILIEKMQNLVEQYTKKRTSTIGRIGDFVKIINTGTIRNVTIGNRAVLEGVRYLYNGSINSNEFDPVHIGYNVMAEDFIISSGSRVEDGTMLTRCFVGQACHLGHTYSASDTLFFSNCQGENGEACATFAGPYTVTHHKSTLLISGMFSFMNAGSGSNQSNHMYKLGPIHQGVMERGGKTTSDSYILWPAKIGAFSLVMGRHTGHSDTSKLPFSYIIECDDGTMIYPGLNLRSVGTIRDAQKFPKRDKRKDPNQLDKLNFNLLSPYTVQKMFQAIEVLTELQKACGKSSGMYTYQNCSIKGTAIEKGLKLYHTAIVKFLGNSIISRLENYPFKTNEEIRERLRPDTEVGLHLWRDLAGLLAPSTEIDRLITDIETDKIKDIEEINSVFDQLHKEYYTLEWTWAWEKIQSYFGVTLKDITAEDIIEIVKQWKDAVIGLDKLIYEDARKEFSLPTHTSFGLDGDRYDKKNDFEQVRGVFEENPFVKAVIEHIQIKSELGDKIIAKLSQVTE